MDHHNAGSDTHRAEQAVLAAAGRQHGVFSRRQAFDLGLTRGVLERRLANGVWESADFGVYRVVGTPTMWHQRLMAACLAGPAVASHRSSAALLKMLDMSTDLIEVTAVRHRRRHVSDVIWHESYHLSEREITEIDGIPVTRAVRTILDLGVVLDADSLEEVLDDALRRGLVSVAGIWRRWEQLGPVRPGARNIAEVLRRKVPGEAPAGSRLETRFRQLLRLAGIDDLVIPQYEIRDRSGRLIGRVDYAIPERKLAIELDGKERHSSRQRVLHDRLREADARTMGWDFVRFDWNDIHDRADWVLRQLRLGRTA